MLTSLHHAAYKLLPGMECNIGATCTLDSTYDIKCVKPPGPTVQRGILRDRIINKDRDMVEC